jgi:Skp family chaperone for outer membrane proteins
MTGRFLFSMLLMAFVVTAGCNQQEFDQENKQETVVWGEEVEEKIVDEEPVEKAAEEEPVEKVAEGKETDETKYKIGVVGVRDIFRNCKRNIRYREESAAEQNRILSELEQLANEIEAQKVSLKTLKQGSDGHTTLIKEILEKQANLQAKQEFYKQQKAIRDQKWIENLYKDILQEIHQVAEQRGLDLVLEKDRLDLSAANAQELGLAIKIRKLLYSGGCLDITDEVMARVDASN